MNAVTTLGSAERSSLGIGHIPFFGKFSTFSVSTSSRRAFPATWKGWTFVLAGQTLRLTLRGILPMRCSQESCRLGGSLCGAQRSAI
jgi:hypothetical protein